MSEIGEMYSHLKAESIVKRGNNREFSANLLKNNNIDFESKNNGSHLIVNHNGKIADFWPGTGKFNIRGEDGYFRGVRNLIKKLNKADKRSQ